MSRVVTKFIYHTTCKYETLMQVPTIVPISRLQLMHLTIVTIKVTADFINDSSFHLIVFNLTDATILIIYDRNQHPICWRRHCDFFYHSHTQQNHL